MATPRVPFATPRDLRVRSPLPDRQTTIFTAQSRNYSACWTTSPSSAPPPPPHSTLCEKGRACTAAPTARSSSRPHSTSRQRSSSPAGLRWLQPWSETTETAPGQRLAERPGLCHGNAGKTPTMHRIHTQRMVVATTDSESNDPPAPRSKTRQPTDNRTCQSQFSRRQVDPALLAGRKTVNLHAYSIPSPTISGPTPENSMPAA